MSNYKTLEASDIEFIKNVINDPKRILYGEEINEEYSHDELSDTKSSCNLNRRSIKDYGLCL